MKKTIIFLTFLFSYIAGLWAETAPAEKSQPLGYPSLRKSYNYFEVGFGPFPLPIPAFALGHRFQQNHHGQDISLYVSTIVAITQVKLDALYHYYPKPNLRSQFYLGGGLGVSGLFATDSHADNHLICLSPEFVMGREFLNKTGDRRFLQMKVGFPTYEIGSLNSLGAHNHVLYYPIVVLSYGICF